MLNDLEPLYFCQNLSFSRAKFILQSTYVYLMHYQLFAYLFPSFNTLHSSVIKSYLDKYLDRSGQIPKVTVCDVIVDNDDIVDCDVRRVRWHRVMHLTEGNTSDVHVGRYLKKSIYVLELSCVNNIYIYINI